MPRTKLEDIKNRLREIVQEQATLRPAIDQFDRLSIEANRLRDQYRIIDLSTTAVKVLHGRSCNVGNDSNKGVKRKAVTLQELANSIRDMKLTKDEVEMLLRG